MNGKYITLAHGSGGIQTHELIGGLFLKYFGDGMAGNGSINGCIMNDRFLPGDDAARLVLPHGRLAYTTDSFVVSPPFFKGGDIGRLSVCGTVNDLSTSGAKPLYLSCSFILEEGFPLADLEKIVKSMADTACESRVGIVTGDTKVVPKGAADGIYINTSGIGTIPDGLDISGANARPGDKVILSGPIGDHGCAVLLERENFGFESDIRSDCAPLNGMVEAALAASMTDMGNGSKSNDNGSKSDGGGKMKIHAMRDPTRGGIATSLNEIAFQSGVNIILNEQDIPVRPEVRAVCELLGMDPLYMACEGRMIFIVAPGYENMVLDVLRAHEYGKDICVIGAVEAASHTSGRPSCRVILKTLTGGGRMADMLSGEHLPRIC